MAGFIDRHGPSLTQKAWSGQALQAENSVQNNAIGNYRLSKSRASLLPFQECKEAQ